MRKTKNSERIQKAQMLALEDMDYILETNETPDFVEIIGKMGGDTITRRFYDDGRRCAK